MPAILGGKFLHYRVGQNSVPQQYHKQSVPAERCISRVKNNRGNNFHLHRLPNFHPHEVVQKISCKIVGVVVNTN